MKKPKLREVAEALKAFVRGPVTTRFPAEPSEPAEAFRGLPQFDEQTCIGCKACAEVCPTECIEVIDEVDADPPMRRIRLRYDICIFCGHCALNCTSETGIQMSSQWDLACLDRSVCVQSVEHELVVCEVCGSAIATRKQLLFIADRLGAQRYANPTLIIMADGQIGLAEPRIPRDDRPLTRDDLMRVTCPRCRRTLVLGELWGQL